MRHGKIIIISVVFIVFGIGNMAMADRQNVIQIVGVGLFVVGLIMLSISVYAQLKK